MSMNIQIQKIIAYAFLIIVLTIQIFNFYTNVINSPYLINDDNLPFTAVNNLFKNPDISETSPSIKYFYNNIPVGYKSLIYISNFIGLDKIVFTKILAICLYVFSIIIIFFYW